MPFRAARPRPRTWKTATRLAGLTLAATLLWHGLRGWRLLAHTREIAAHSASFSRDYVVGSGPEITYLSMGDSAAAGWGAEQGTSTYPHQIASALAAHHFRVHVVNVAIGGATLAQVRRAQSAALGRVRPDLVTLAVGANDATHGTSDADFARDLRALLADLRASQAKLVLVANLPDMALAPALPWPVSTWCGARARALNRVLQASPRSSKLQIIDLFGRGELDYARDPGLFAADLFHPSARGYTVWAALWNEKIDAALRSGGLRGR